MTNTSSIRILVVDDEAGVRNLIGLALKHQGYSADFAEDMSEATGKLHQNGARYTALLLDLGIPGLRAVVEEARRSHLSITVIGLVNDPAMPERKYVDDVVQKPVTGEKLRAAIQQCLRERQKDSPASEHQGVHADVTPRSSVWQSEIQPLIAHVASSDVPVLIQGETGVGKEVLARQLHSQSPRAKKPFLKVNCAALPSELIESELFGYERGAFTGAFKNTPGKFEMADGGSILLDEIGDMDFKLQAKLLQVLQDREFIRLGSSEPRQVDVRILAATHCNLEQAIIEKRFREDLYYRLNIITIHVPALRDRREEILPLAYHFMRKHGTAANPAVEITTSLRNVLLSHDWPGNVRELENVIRRLLVLRKPDLVADDIFARARRFHAVYTSAPVHADNTEPAAAEPVVTLPKAIPEALTVAAAGVGQLHLSSVSMPHRPQIQAREDADTSSEYRAVSSTPSPRPLRIDEADHWSILDRVDEARREAETDAILQALNSTLWNRKRAAQLLSIDYKALLYKMKKLGIVDRAAKIAI